MVGLSLHRASVYFDRDPLYDAYNGSPLFCAQVGSFEAAMPNGAFQRRRSVSFGPQFDLPASRAVKIYDQVWILGDATQDGWESSVVRQNASARIATDLFAIQSPAAAIDKDESYQVYGYKEFYRNSYDKATAAENDLEFEIMLPKPAALKAGYFLSAESGVYLLSDADLNPEGFWQCYATRLRNPLTGLDDSGIFVEATMYGDLDPITEEREKGETYDGLMLKRYLLYFNKAEAAKYKEAGDVSLILSGGIQEVPKVADQLEIADYTWTIETVQPYHDAWLLHIRKV